MTTHNHFEVRHCPRTGPPNPTHRFDELLADGGILPGSFVVIASDGEARTWETVVEVSRRAAGRGRLIEVSDRFTSAELREQVAERDSSWLHHPPIESQLKAVGAAGHLSRKATQ